MPGSRPSAALESLARLRTMRGLIPGEDRMRFERLISDVEHAVSESETVNADLARLIAIGVTEAPIRPAVPVEMTDVVASALRGLDGLLSSRGIRVGIDAPPATFVMGDRERLVHLVAAAMAIAASAARSTHDVRLRYGLGEHATPCFEITPYAAADPRATIVEALARSQDVQLDTTDARLTMRLPSAVGAASA